MSTASKGAATTTILAVVVSLVVAGAGGFMAGQRSGQRGATMEGQVVATVNDVKITKQDVYDRMVTSGGQTAVQDLIDEALVDQAAKAANVAVTAAEVDAAMAKIKEQMGGEEQFTQALQMYGISAASFRDYQEFRLKATKILGKDITVEEAELQQFFTDHVKEYDKRQIHARHILVADEETAKAVKAELDKGTDFATLAKEKSTEPAAQQTGGDLGTFGRGKMDTAFEEVVFALKKDEISAPFQTQFGWHVAQVLEITGDAPTYEAVKETVKEDLIAQKVNEKLSSWLEELRSDAKITNTLETAAAQ